MAFSSSTATTTVKREEADKSLETAKRRQPIKTPKRVKMKSEDEDQPDIPSLQMPGNVKVDWNELPPSLTKFLEALVQQIGDIHSVLIGTNRDVDGLETVFNKVGSDLDILDSHVKNLFSQIGNHLFSSFNVPNLWSAIDAVMDSLTSNVKHVNLLNSELSTLRSSMDLSKYDNFMQVQQGYWKVITPLIQ